MGKRFGKGNDATQDVSVSQFVPPKAPTRGNPQNDMSLWGGVIVGTSDFAPPVLKRPKPSRRKWIIGGAVVAALALGSGVFVLMRGGSNKSASSTDRTTSTDKAGAASPDKTGGASPDKAGAASTDKAASTEGASSTTNAASTDHGAASATDKAGAAGSTATGSTATGSTATGSTGSTMNGSAANGTTAPGSMTAASAADGSSASSSSAAADSAGVPTGPTVAAVTGNVDAITGVAPVIKTNAKKKPTVRKVVKKPAPKKTVPKRK